MTDSPRIPPLDPLASAAKQIRPQPKASTPPAERAEPQGSGIWMPPLFLGAVLLGVTLLLRRPDALWAYVVGGIFAVVFGWFLVSTLWPSRPERQCPACGGEGLARLNTESHRGLRCELCGFEDEASSSFMLAEEEGTLEETVMRERGRLPQWSHAPDVNTQAQAPKETL